MTSTNRAGHLLSKWVTTSVALFAGWNAIAAADFNLTRDFTTNNNPNGVWSYGWKGSLGNPALNLYTHNHTGFADNGAPVQVIDAADQVLPEIYFNGGTNTVITDGGAGVFPPRTVWFGAGNNGAAQNFCVIRFTAPSNASYHVGVAVAGHLPPNLSGDTDFYVVRNSSELNGWFLPPGGQRSFTNVYALAAGDTLDFAIGRGADGNVNASALKISALITPTNETGNTNPPPVCTFALSPSNRVHSFGAATNFVAVTTQPDCLWTALSTNPWVHVAQITNAGSGSVSYSLDANNSVATRFGAIHINGQNFFITQLGATNGGTNLPGCTFVLTPSSATFGGTGGTGFVSVATGSNCLWTALTTNTWIHVASPTNSGSRTLSYLVDANPALQARSGAIRIDGQNFIIGQAGTPDVTNPPPVFADFNLARDFSTNSNPNGVWSYGWKSNLTSGLVLFPFTRTGFDNFGYPYQIWEPGTGALPGVYFNAGTNTLSSDGGQGVYPPRTVWFYPGNSPRNLGVIRFTAPSNSNYEVGVAVKAVLDGPSSGDTDFHVVKNSTEIFGQQVPGQGATSYTNILSLNIGDVVEFAVGRGADNSLFGSDLKIQALITPTTNEPTVTNQPPVCTFALSPSNRVHAATGGTGVVSVVTQAGCPWSAFSSNFWIHVSPFTNVTVGSGTVTYFVDANTSSVARVGSIRIDGRQFFVNQQGAPIVTNPPVFGDFNLSRDFLVNANPSGGWRYGWKQSLDGTFGLLPAFRTFASDNGVQISAWELSTYNLPVVAKVTGNALAISDGGRFTAPSGTVYFAPGSDGTPQNYGVIRFVAPSNGNYAVQAAISPLFDGTRSRDSDFHVVKNGVQVYGVELPPNFGTNAFSGVMTLIAGEAVDFAIGRGTDGTTLDTGLKINAVVAPTTNGATIIVTNPPPAFGDFNLVRDFSTNTNPNGMWSYGWQTNISTSITLLNRYRNSSAGPGAPYQILEYLSGSSPLMMYYPLSNTSTGSSGATLYPPGTLLLDPGTSPPFNFVTVRFTAPSNGNYQVRATVAPQHEDSRQGDTDFHVARNGGEIFGQFLAPLDRVNYSNVLALLAGDKLDFAIGRGADGSEFASIERVTAVITPVAPPPPPPGTNQPPTFGDFNLTRDFSTNGNPNGVWTYGWKQSFTNPISAFTSARTAFGDNGVPVQVLESTAFRLPELLFNPSTNTATSDGGQAQYPPRTMWFYPGVAGTVQTFGAIRFVCPSNGNYQVGVGVRSYLNGPSSGDTDFHVLKNGAELFGQFLPPEGSASFTNTLELTAGDAIEFLVGRGADNSSYGSGLKIAALITPTVAAPALNAPGETKVARVNNFIRLANGDIQFTVTGDRTTTYVIEASSDLMNWVQVGTVVNSGGVIQFSDPDASSSPTRFYRATPVAP